MSVFLLHVFLWILCQNLKHVQYKQCIGGRKKEEEEKKKSLHIDISFTLLYHAQNHFIHTRKVYSANRVTKLPRFTVNEISCLLSE
jgi:hypothetical protein